MNVLTEWCKYRYSHSKAEGNQRQAVKAYQSLMQVNVGSPRKRATYQFDLGWRVVQLALLTGATDDMRQGACNLREGYEGTPKTGNYYRQRLGYLPLAVRNGIMNVTTKHDESDDDESCGLAAEGTESTPENYAQDAAHILTVVGLNTSTYSQSPTTPRLQSKP